MAKPSKVKNKHMLRLCKPILLENYLIYVCVYIYNIYMEICIQIHKVTLFIIAKKNWKQVKCSTVQEKINYGMAIVKMNELKLHISTQMNHRILGEKNKLGKKSKL